MQCNPAAAARDEKPWVAKGRIPLPRTLCSAYAQEGRFSAAHVNERHGSRLTAEPDPVRRKRRRPFTHAAKSSDYVAASVLSARTSIRYIASSLAHHQPPPS
jgi:hypothetical protein